MGFDKIFVHLIDKYIATGLAKGVYDEKTVEKIVERGNILRPLLLGSQAPDLLMIDTTNAKITNKMGFDTAKTSKSVTQLYYDNAQKLTPLFTTLYGVKAKWTILVFWDVDCGHCQTEMPKLGETYRELVKKYDVKVFSVYTQHEYDKWRKFIIDKKMNFINVYDPVHLNNIKEKYDIFSTPVIYLLDKNKVIKAKRLAEEQLPELIKMFDAQDKEAPKK
jgi:thiol-disulfide isomerase/thioredoxin